MFDPLHKWLGIPPSEQPPNDYRLLGLALFEHDPEVIDAAADRDLAYLHDLTNGEHGELAEELANQISAARLKLLNKKRREAYDAQLRAQEQVSSGLNQAAAEQAAIHRISGHGVATQADAATPAVPPEAHPDAASVLGMPPGFPPVSPMPPGTQTVAPNPTVNTPVAASAPSSPNHPPVKTKSAAPNIRARAAAVLPRHRTPLLAWTLGVLPGVLILGYLVFSIITGRLQLDEEKLQKLGVSQENAAALSGSSKAADGRTAKPETRIAADPARPHRNPEPLITPRSPAANSIPSRGPYQTPGGRQPMVSSGSSSTAPSVARPGKTYSPIPPPRSPSLAEYLPGGKHRLPDATDIEEKMQTVSDLYESKYSSAKTDSEKIAVANEIMLTAADTRDDPEGVFALYRVARNIYVAAGDYQPALDIIDRIDEEYADVDSLGLKHDVLTKMPAPISRSETFIKTVINLATQCLRQGQIANGLEVCNLIDDDIRRIPASSRAWVKELKSQLADAQMLFDDYESGAMDLEADPENSRAQFAAGKYLCLVENRWNEGLPRLAAGSDNGYREAAESEVAWKANGPAGLTGVSHASAGNALTVADRWYDLMLDAPTPFEKRVLAAHLKSIYQSARRTTSGLESKKIDERLLRVNALAEPIAFAAASVESASVTPRARNTRPTPSTSGVPHLLQSDSWESPDNQSRLDLAQVRGGASNGRILTVGMGNRSDGMGEAAAGVELQDASTVQVSVQSQSNSPQLRPTSKGGYMIDYHTTTGYSNRVFLHSGINQPAGSTDNPPWGAGRRPIREERLSSATQHRIDLRRYAPPGWDGRCWFSVYMHDMGMNQSVTANVSWE